MFALYVPGLPNAVARGGRYDHVGEAFGRARPATGFSLDLRELARLLPTADRKHAIRAPWGNAPELREKIAELRNSRRSRDPVHAGSRECTGRVRVRPRARPRTRKLDSQKLRLSDVKYC
jgi:ATP phosphoribosyltransferase regulatory subunit HisZ